MTNSSTFNVKEYGANGIAESDTSSVKNALGQLYVNGGGTLYFPVGHYQLDAQISIQQFPGLPIGIIGDGPGLSVITWICKDGGIAIESVAEGGFDGHKGAIMIRGLSLQTIYPEGGTAINIHTQGSHTSPAPKKLIRDIIFAGSSPDAGWSIGVRSIDCTFMTISDVDYQGKGVAIQFDGEHHPVDNYVHHLRVFQCKYGIEILGNSEGIYISQSTILFADRGISWTTKSEEPLLSVIGTHISASHDCIYASNLLQPIISGNLLYRSGDSPWTGIWLSGNSSTPYNLIQISHNTIHGFPAGDQPQNGIVITNRSGGIIQGNAIHHVDTGIWLQPGTSRQRVLDNFIQDIAAFDIKDDGADNVVRRI